MSDEPDATTSGFDNLLSSASTTTTANASAAGAATQPKPRSLVPGIDAFLGHGYDVFGEFASPVSVRARIYDLPNEPRVDQQTIDRSLTLSPEQLAHAFVTPPEELKLIYARPEHVGYTDMFEASIDVRQIDATDKHENNWGIGGKIEGSYGGFTGEISARFDTATAQLATTKCLQATFEMVYWKLDVGNYSYTHPPPIVDEVRQDFANRTVDDLMMKYGTHCLEDIGIGTKIVHSYTIDTSKFSKSVDVEAAIKAKYQGGGWSAGANVEGEYSDKAWNDRSAVRIRIMTYGTSDSQLAEITDLTQGLGEHPLNVLSQGWHNPTLIKFYPTTLKPIWKIENLMSAEKAAEFEKRFNERARTSQGAIAMLFRGLQPLYLLSTTTAGKKRYRFCTTVHYADAAGEWTVENDGKPWLYASAEPRPGLVPLVELAFNDDMSVVRYETETMANALGTFSVEEGYKWSRTGRVMGYVYENNGSAVPEGADPVYAYYSSDLTARSGVFYSHLKELIWDGGWWKPSSDARLFYAEDDKIRRAQFEAWWNSQDWWTRTFTQKPEYRAANMGYSVDNAPPLTFYSPGIPHWFALQPG